ncbi:MAG: leucyl-tRNA synthetase [Limisphaerales bacterium]|jgi:leucyl-tRNA synthetase
MRRQYPFQIFEPKWQEHWHNGETFRAWNPGESVPSDHPFHERHPDVNPGDIPKYYILDMFPYPSGAGLHVGHPEGYTATDILARYKRMLGFNVLHPIGWDAFGLPAEQYAIKTGQHPRITTEANTANFKRQIQSLGFSYDWSREVNTTDPSYFRWTQWIFLQLYNSWFNPATNKAESIDTLAYPLDVTTDEQRRTWRDEHRLAYVSDAPVNWCPELGTVLANEEVKDGISEVGGFPVVRRPMQQWKLRITEYAQRLLEDLDGIDWSDSLKEMQRNWIGRSEGAEVLFRVEDSDVEIAVFTTRPDTLFGATYMVVSTESELLEQIVPPKHKAEVRAYQAEAAKKSDLERTDLAKDKSGVFTGAHAINPVNGRQVPIWTADYVLSGYGTGAIMAVPAHDSRDMEFAQKFKLPIEVVVQAPGAGESLGFTGNGMAVNSGFLDGLPTPEAKSKIIAWLEEKSLGQGAVNYKLRDWLFSRQRYWGEPFPIVWDEGGHLGLSESDLPLTPPDLTDFKPTGAGDPPLARAEEWCQAGDGQKRETNTMPQWAGSCWYYLRYLDAQNNDRFVGDEAERYWMGSASDDATPGVDLYVGGTEHAVLHLLYARFWHKVLFDLGQVTTPEPFYKLVNQGLILGEDGQKMSKSRGNAVNPDDILVEFGSDAFRLYEMFMGPLEMVKPWNTKGVEGVYRFLGRVWRMFIDEQSEQEFEQQLTVNPERGPELLAALKLNDAVGQAEATPEQLKVLHTCIKKVTEDMEHLRFNTAISAMMVFTNEASNWDIRPLSVMNDFMLLLAPFAPHIAEELYAKANGVDSTLAYHPWPSHDEAHLVESTIEMAVQVNGKLRDRIQIPADMDKSDIERIAMESENVQRHTEGKNVKKVIVIQGKLVNIVAV